MGGRHDSATLVHAVTRFLPPSQRPEFVRRRELIDRVLTPGARLVFASGPAGSGKSTLLAQAFDACPDAVWLSIERSDDDPAVLWSALIDSMAATISGFGESYRHRLDTAGAEAVDKIIPLFVNELTDTGRPIRLFLDDLHLLSNKRSLESLRRLLKRLPPGACLIAASRAAAPFFLGRLRLERTLVEIGPTDLAMGVGEARAALLAAGVEHDDEQVAALISRTEGWVAGLAWATLALQHDPDPGSLVERINGLDGELTEYLIEEVLDQRSAEVRAFMLETSILDRFNASLCDHLRDRDDSRAILDELNRTNSFIVPLDRHGEWHRYHHLVQDVLSARLRHESSSSVPVLHERAASWLSTHGQVVDSIRHARAAGDSSAAADLLCAHWWEMFNRGRIETVYSLFEEFGSPEICAYQPLAVAGAFLYSLAGDHQNAQVYFRAAERGHFEGPPPDGSASPESSLAIMRGSVAFDGVDAVLASGQRACELEPEDSPWRPLAVFLVAIGHIWRGEIDEALPQLDDVVGQARLNEALKVYALGQVALIRLARGDLDGAASAADRACALAVESGLETLFSTALPHGAAAACELAAGNIDAANRHLDAALVPMASVKAAMPLDAMQSRIVLADAAIRLGRISDARRFIDDATRTDQRYKNTGILTDQLAAVSELLTEVDEAVPVEVSAREQAVLDLLPSDLSIREIGEALFISKETVKSHRRRIYQKLSASNRTEAIVAARLVGLLPELNDDAGGVAQAGA